LKADTGEVVKIYDIPEKFGVSRSPLAAQPAVVDNYIIFATENGVVYKIDTTSQEITALAALTGSIIGPLTAYQGIIYFQTQDIAMQRIIVATGELKTSISLISG
jgi:outer membrane protein assembly factor BamB